MSWIQGIMHQMGGAHWHHLAKIRLIISAAVAVRAIATVNVATSFIYLLTTFLSFVYSIYCIVCISAIFDKLDNKITLTISPELSTRINDCPISDCIIANDIVKLLPLMRLRVAINLETAHIQTST